ncbi:MAG: FtsX-like permease family protein [Olsenella sp.]|nr:FtsX-like permease family protein [Olsenella sp.]
MGARGHGTRRPVRTRSAFAKGVLRSIRSSLGRFLAIMGIVALGCGFYAGLKMCGPDMRLAADRLYDGTGLWDLRVVSTLGFDDADVARVAGVEGVGAAMPSRTVDAMARVGDEQVAVRISSLDVAAAATSSCGEASSETDDPSYLNRPILREGSWPSAPDECVVSAAGAGALAIGDTVTVLYGTSSLDEELEERSFTVTGRVLAPDYVYTGSYGSTTLGSGSVEHYLYVPEGAFLADAPYTEVYLEVAGASSEPSGSDAYESAVGEVKGRIEDAAGELAQARQDALRRRAQDELDEKVREYDERHDETYGELADAKATLDDSASRIEEGARQLAEGQRELDEGLAAYESARDSAASQLADAQAALDEGAAELASRREELVAAEAAWQEGMAGLAAALGPAGVSADTAQGYADALDERLAAAASARATLDDLRTQLAQAEAAVAARDEAAARRQEVADGIADVDARIAALDASSEGFEEARSALEAEREELEGALAQLDAALAAADQAEGAIAPLEGAIAQLEAALPTDEELTQLEQARSSAEALAQARSQLDDGRAQLAAGEDELARGQAELDQRRLDAKGELSSAKGRLDEAAARLSSSRAQLEDARSRYEEGLSSYEDGLAEADDRFGTAWSQIEDAQAEIDAIELPDVYVLDRTQSEGAATYRADTERMDHIADVFPLIFFLVAALVALTTMTRMVEDDRVVIGTYKALGYGKARIASRYLAYALAAAGAGAVLGMVVLSQVLPSIVIGSYAIIYAVPPLPRPLPLDALVALQSGGLGVGVTLAATWAAVWSSLSETPAELMLPRAPKPGRRILLERARPLWRRLSFLWKVCARNLFRYKRRLLMTVVGIAGCTALLLVGFGLHDSIWDIIELQFGPTEQAGEPSSIVRYNTTVGMDGTADELDVSAVTDLLASSGAASGVTRVQAENMQAGGTGGDEGATATTRVSVVVPESAEELGALVDFRDRRTQEPVPFDDGSVLVTEKLASLHGISVGDQVVLFDQDEVGNVRGKGRALTVTGVVENYVGNYVYVGRDAWREASLEEPSFSTMLCELEGDAAAHAEVSGRLHELSHVSTVVFSDEAIDQYRSMLSVVDVVVVVLIVSAAALAFIVLYNLTNINVEERIREIATLKVLGFTRREVYRYVFRETLLLTLMGDALGLLLGVWLENFVVTTAEVDYVMFGRAIHPASFVAAFALTVAFSLAVMVIMRRKLDGVDMVESLKSVD